MPPQGPETYRMLAQWYVSLMSMSVAWLMIAILCSTLCLLYSEPLNDKACLSLMSDNIMYFGCAQLLCPTRPTPTVLGVSSTPSADL